LRAGCRYALSVRDRFNERQQPKNSSSPALFSSRQGVSSPAVVKSDAGVCTGYQRQIPWSPPSVRPITNKSERRGLHSGSTGFQLQNSDQVCMERNRNDFSIPDSVAAVRETFRHGVTVQRDPRNPTAWTAAPAAAAPGACHNRRSSTSSLPSITGLSETCAPHPSLPSPRLSLAGRSRRSSAPEVQVAMTASSSASRSLAPARWSSAVRPSQAYLFGRVVSET
jgi:hypothetical protein